MNKWTELVNFDQAPGDLYHPNSTPIYQTATFALESVTGGGKYDYTRSGNPTRSVLEAQLAKLEAGKYAFTFSSGMAALTALTGLLKTGENILVADDLYGGTYRLLTKRLQTHKGISVSFVDMTDLEAVKHSLLNKPKIVLLETPSNPLQKIADIAAIAELIHQHNALLAIDNSFMSPWLQQPLKLGADIVIHSATKHLSGHSDVSGGVIIVNDTKLAEELAFIQNAEGAALAPFDSWLILRGLKTLGLRIEREETNALKIIDYLKTKLEVEKIYYPLLEEHPGVAIHKKQATGGGSVICFIPKSVELAIAIVENTKLFKISVSFGGLTSSISLPNNMSHASIPENMRFVPDALVRLSIGIEDSNDLIDDLERVFTLFKQ